MKKMYWATRLLLGIYMISLLFSCQQDPNSQIAESCGEESMKNIVLTEDTQVVLYNPDMGWVMYDNYVISKKESPAYSGCPSYGNNYPYIQHVMIKFTWGDIEKVEGKYDWSDVDYIVKYWQDRGKTVQLGMVADSLLWYGKSGRGCPDYVLAKLDETEIQTRNYIGYKYVNVDANNPYYQERLKLYLAECNKKCDEYGIEMLDLRGYGLWGEWHSGYQYETKELRVKALRAIIDIWVEAFPNKYLTLSYTHEPDYPLSNSYQYEEYLEYSAYDYALQFDNITFRRDGCGGPIQTTERMFAANVFAEMNRGPFTSEANGGYERDNLALVQRSIDDGLDLHANYFTIFGWCNVEANDFCKEQPQMVEYVLRNIGYRFVAESAEYPSVVSRGDKLTVNSTWFNRAVGRAVQNYRVLLTLSDEEGKILYSFDGGLSGCDQWRKEQKDGYELNSSATIGDEIESGVYRLCLSFYSDKHEQTIGLAMVGNTIGEEQGIYLGPLTVRE